MAGPPRFTSMPMPLNGMRHFPGGRGGMMPHPPRMGLNMPPMQQQPSAPSGPPPTPSQVTTVFVGNISDKADNDFVKQMLDMCGKVVAWKRMAGVNGKLQGFGFCDFEEPADTLRSLRVLNEFQLGDKKLIVKVEQKHRDQLKAFAEREAKQTAKPGSEELPASEEALKKDEEVRLKILALIESQYPDLVKFEDGELSDKEKDDKDKKKVEGTAEKKTEERKDKKKRRSRSRETRSRSRSKSGRRARSRSPRNKRRRRGSSSRSSTRSSSRSSSSGSSTSRSTHKRSSRRKSRSASRGSEDSEEARERRNLKREVREKEMAYAARLRDWEAREKKQAKKYEKDEQKVKNRKLDILKEAKKLKAFLEDYDDEKDDPKYYKSSSLFARRRDFEREKEADAKDRQREQQEIEELKKQILEEAKTKEKENMEAKDLEDEAMRRHQEKEAAARAKKNRDGSGSPNPHQLLGQKRRAEEEDSSSDSASDDEEKAEDEDNAAVVKEASKWATVAASPSNSITGSNAASSPAGGAASASPLPSSSSLIGVKAPVVLKQSAVFADGDEDNDDDMFGRKKLKPFEITHEERMKTLTAGELKKLHKQIADSIPSDKERDKLFEYPIKLDLLKNTGAITRLKPWVARKIKEYIGDEDQSLINFICDKVEAGTPPAMIVQDIAMIIDNEAETFTAKLWRLLAYETECAVRGVPTNSSYR